MGKKSKQAEDPLSSANPASKETKKASVDGGINFDSSDATLEAAQEQVNLPHVTKVWTRDAYERARPWILEQRQKLETMGWTSVEGVRTELFVLKKPAPQGSFTEDGFIYIRVPKKFIDFNRSGKGSGGEDGAAAAEETAEADEGDKKKKKASRLSKKSAQGANYQLQDPLVWKIKIDGANSEEVGREPSVCLDVPEPMENIMYLVMTLQPGLIQLHAKRNDVIQAGTRESSTRDDADKPTVRHSAMVASSEAYTRTLPPAFWFKRNVQHLCKIMSPTGNTETSKEYDDTMAAADNVQRAVTRVIKDVKEKTWEEELPGGGSNAAKAPKEASGNGAPAATSVKKNKKAAAAAAAGKDTAVAVA